MSEVIASFPLILSRVWMGIFTFILVRFAGLLNILVLLTYLLLSSTRKIPVLSFECSVVLAYVHTVRYNVQLQPPVLFARLNSFWWTVDI
jgi:hypothetical protein